MTDEGAGLIAWTYLLTFCVANGIGPSEFWDMTLPETLAIVQALTPPDPKTALAGSLTRADVETLKNWDPDGAS